MLTASTPPAPSAMSDAVAVIKLIQDPQAAADTLKRLNEATDKATKAAAAIAGKKEELDAREKALDAQEAKLEKARALQIEQAATLDATEKELAKGTRDLAEAKLAHKNEVEDFRARLAQHEAAMKKAAAENAAALEGIRARAAALEIREAEVKKKAEALEKREAQLRDFLK